MTKHTSLVLRGRESTSKFMRDKEDKQMKQVMKFNLYSNVVAVYYCEESETYLIYQMIGRKKFFIDEVEGCDPAAQIAMNFCYENA